MRRGHFEAFRPVCPLCLAAGRHAAPLVIAEIFAEAGGDIEAAILHCPAAGCRQEYPVIDGVPVIVADMASVLAQRGAELLLRHDLPAPLESLVGDALGQESWLDAARQVASTYGWDSYAAFDPAERAQEGGPVPGAAARCMNRLIDFIGQPPGGLALDLGCSGGGSSFALAARAPDALVLGIDINPGLLRLARRAMRGVVAYPRRRIGLVYDRRCFTVDLAGAARVDFWMCDAAALPFPESTASLTAALNVLDCVPAPSALLSELARVTRAGGHMLLASPYDWSVRATPVQHWVGGHSQRADHEGAAESFLRTLLTPGAHPHSVAGVDMIGEVARWPWQTRLHDRSHVTYATHLVAAMRTS